MSQYKPHIVLFIDTFCPMTQTEELIHALKRVLRSKGLTYADVATHIKVSESSVKRLFSSHNFSLARLQSICELADVEFADLVSLAEDNRRNIEQLSEDQELEIVSDTKLLLMTFLLLNLWKLQDIMASYQIDEFESIRLLARLDRLKIIDLLPENRVRMRLSRNFNWRRNGPIQRFFEQRVQSEFFRSRFDGPNEQRLVLNGMLSDQSIAIMRQRIQRLASDFDQLIKDDARLDIEQRHGTTAILAFRPWGLSAFEKLRRPATS